MVLVRPHIKRDMWCDILLQWKVVLKVNNGPVTDFVVNQCLAR